MAQNQLQTDEIAVHYSLVRTLPKQVVTYQNGKINSYFCKLLSIVQINCHMTHLVKMAKNELLLQTDLVQKLCTGDLTQKMKQYRKFMTNNWQIVTAQINMCP